MKYFIKCLVIASITAMGALTGTAYAAGEKLVFIYHSGDEDFWWNTIKNTLKQAESGGRQHSTKQSPGNPHGR